MNSKYEIWAVIKKYAKENDEHISTILDYLVGMYEDEEEEENNDDKEKSNTLMNISSIKQEDFDRILTQIVSENTPESLLLTPGVYDVLSEYFNNEVIDRWDREKTGEVCVDYDDDNKQIKNSQETSGINEFLNTLEKFVESDNFWNQQPYGTRLYYGNNANDYLHRSNLRSAITILRLKMGKG